MDCLYTPGWGVPDRNTPRLAALDALRGLAALTVVLHHLWLLGAWQPSAAWQWRLLRYTPLHIIVEGRQPVILFFVLSGYVLARALLRAPVGYGTFMVRRFTRIYLPFAAAILVSDAAYALIDPSGPRPFSAWFGGLWSNGSGLSTLLGHLALPGTGRDDLDPVIWSLVHELRISAIVPALLWAARRRLAPMMLASAALQVATGIDPGGKPFWGQGALGSLLVTGYFVPFFVLGIALAAREPRLPAWSTWPLLLAAMALLSGAAGANDLAYGAGATLLIALAPRCDRMLSVAPLLFLGRISYSLYLVHLPLFLVVIYALHAGSAALPLLVPASLLAGWGFNALVERPSQRLGALLTAQPASGASASASARA